MSDTEANETVADAMVTVEAIRIDASRRALAFHGQTQGSALNDWGEIFAFTPQTQSAEFASANGL